MTKFLLFFLVLLSFLNFQSQSSFNRVYHDQKENTGPLLTNIYGDYYYSSNTYNFSDYGNCYIYKYGANGNLKARIPFHVNFSEFAILNAAIKTNDNKLLLVGHVYGVCDLPDTSKIRTFISKIDTNGNVLFIKKIKRPYPNPFSFFNADNFKNVLQNADSTYCTFTDSVMYKFSKTGQLLFRKNLALDSISSCLLLPNNSILLSARQNSTSSLITISQNGMQLTSQLSPTLFKKISFYNGQKIMGLGYNQSLYKFSPTLDLIGNSNPSFFAAKDYLVSNDTIYSISINNYCRTDTSFNILSVHTNTTQKLSQIALIKNNNFIGISSLCTNQNVSINHSFSSLNVINKTSDNSFVNDIEVSSVIADSVYWPPNDFHVYLKAKVKVKNKGTTVINEFTLNSDRNITAQCGGLYYQQKFTQTIQPGDSAVVTTSFIHRQFFTMTPNSPTASVQYCLFSTMPNGQNDRFIGNDELCKSFIFTKSTSALKEISEQENMLSLFPNPFENTLVINSETEIKSIEIFNSLGMLIDTKILNSKAYSYYNMDLVPAIYFIKLNTQKGIQIKKVIKH